MTERKTATAVQRQFALQKAVETMGTAAVSHRDITGAVLTAAGKYADFLANGPADESTKEGGTA